MLRKIISIFFIKNKKSIETMDRIIKLIQGGNPTWGWLDVACSKSAVSLYTKWKSYKEKPYIDQVSGKKT